MAIADAIFMLDSTLCVKHKNAANEETLNMSKTFTVAEAAELIAAQHESRAAVANQLRRLVQRGAVRTVGQSGSGRTAANLFSIADLATARVQRTLIALGIASDDVQREVAIACYNDGEAMHHVAEDVARDARDGALPRNWNFYLTLSVPDEGGSRTMKAAIVDADGPAIENHPAEAARITVPMREWLLALVKAAG